MGGLLLGAPKAKFRQTAQDIGEPLQLVVFPSEALAFTLQERDFVGRFGKAAGLFPGTRLLQEPGDQSAGGELGKLMQPDLGDAEFLGGFLPGRSAHPGLQDGDADAVRFFFVFRRSALPDFSEARRRAIGRFEAQTLFRAPNATRRRQRRRLWAC
jgi:hypothetical protein